MNKSEVSAAIVSLGLIPIIRTASTDDARAVAEAVVAGGISIIEIPTTVPNAVQLIYELSKNWSDKVLVGAGTVLNAEMARECIGAGGKFMIAPGTDFEMIEYCNRVETVVIPGAFTATEIINAWDAGADFVKVFPIAIVGAQYLKLLKGPLPNIKLVATGGITQAIAGDLLRAGAEAIGIGPDLVDIPAIREGRPEVISNSARKYLEIVAEARAAK